jgi:hypothetical protein
MYATLRVNADAPLSLCVCLSLSLCLALAGLAGNGSLQANTLIANNSAFPNYYPNMRDETMFPFLWTQQSTEITPVLADFLQSDLFSLLDIAFVIWYSLMALGAVILLAVAVFFVRERRIVATTGYTSIND